MADQPWYMEHPTTPINPTALTNTLVDILSDTINARGGQVPATSTASTSMTPYSGFASRYAPGQLSGIYDNPTAVLPDVFQGFDWASPLGQTFSNMRADPLALYNLLVGAGQSFQDRGDALNDESFVNWLAGMYKNLGTAGGKGFSISNMLGNLFGQDLSPESEGGSKTALANILQSGDTNQQANFLYSLIRDATNVGMNPLAAAGYQSAIARSLDQWRNDILKGTSGQNAKALDWIRQNNPGLVIG